MHPVSVITCLVGIWIWLGGEDISTGKPIYGWAWRYEDLDCDLSMISCLIYAKRKRRDNAGDLSAT